MSSVKGYVLVNVESDEYKLLSEKKYSFSVQKHPEAANYFKDLCESKGLQNIELIFELFNPQFIRPSEGEDLADFIEKEVYAGIKKFDNLANFVEFLAKCPFRKKCRKNTKNPIPLAKDWWVTKK